MNYTILTDSCADLTPSLIEKLGVRVIPMVYEIDGQKYHDDVFNRTQTMEEFFNLINVQKKIAKTSQVTPEEYLHYFSEEYAKGNPILVVAFSSALSGTCNASFVARNQFLEEHPDANIIIVDTLGACGGEGLLVTYAASNRNEKGMTIEENAKWLEDNKLHLCHRFTVDDLNVLKRGGRLSATSAFLGTLIGIKPVLHVDDEGRLVPTDKVRGRKQSLSKLAEYVKRDILNPEDQEIYISHADCIDSAELLKSMILEAVPVKKVTLLPFGPIIGAHTGAGAIAVFYFGTKR